MSMSFRKAPISFDGNRTFVDGRDPIRACPHTFELAAPTHEPPKAADYIMTATTCTRCEAMRAKDYEIHPVGEVESFLDSEAGHWLQTSLQPPQPSTDSAAGRGLLIASLPDGVRCALPRNWPLSDDVCLNFGCDF